MPMALSAPPATGVFFRTTAGADTVHLASFGFDRQILKAVTTHLPAIACFNTDEQTALDVHENVQWGTVKEFCRFR